VPAQIKVLGICALILAAFGGGLYAAISTDDSLDVASNEFVEATVLELERVEGMDLSYSAGKGRAGVDVGKMPGHWVAVVELPDGEVIRVRAGNPPVSVGEVIDVQVTAFESGDLAGLIVNQY